MAGFCAIDDPNRPLPVCCWPGCVFVDVEEAKNPPAWNAGFVAVPNKPLPCGAEVVAVVVFFVELNKPPAWVVVVAGAAAEDANKVPVPGFEKANGALAWAAWEFAAVLPEPNRPPAGGG